MRVFDDFNLPDFWQNPIPVFQRSFASGDRLQASPDCGLAVLGYEALRQVGRHPAIDGTPVAEPSGTTPNAVTDLFRYAPFAQVASQHRTLRRAVLAGLNPGAIDTFSESIEPLILDRLRNFRGEPFDLVSDFVTPFAAEAWCGFMGYGTDEASAIADEIARIVPQIAFRPDPEGAADADEAAISLTARTSRMLASSSGGAGKLIAAELPSSDSNVATGVVASLLFDAIDTATAGLSGLLAVLLDHPEHHRMLIDRATRETAIEEALRLATPAMLTVRQASDDLVFAGTPIAKGALVWMWWAAGNTDPEVFDEPASFRVDRPARGLPFGIGPHSCLGHVWIKTLAHTLVRLSFTGCERMIPVSTGHTWIAGGARRPHGLRVAFR